MSNEVINVWDFSQLVMLTNPKATKKSQEEASSSFSMHNLGD